MNKRRHKTIKQILALTLAVLLACQGNIVALAEVQAPVVSEQTTGVEKKATPTETPKKSATETPKTTATETPKTTATVTETPKETAAKASEETDVKVPEKTPAEPAEEPLKKAPADPVESVRALFAALPQTLTAEEWKAMTEEEQAALYEQLEAAGFAYDALAEDEKEILATAYDQWIAMVKTVQQASDVALLESNHQCTEGGTYDKVLTGGGTLAEGNYYLTGDLTINSTLKISVGANEVVRICLNGHSIIRQTNGDVFEVNSGKLVLCDCRSVGEVTHASGITGVGVSVWRGATFIMSSGNIVGNKIEVNEGTGGGGIYNKGTVEINGGTIDGNSVGANGGGIYNKGTLRINGGTISNNESTFQKGYGGGIYNEGSLTIINASICNNTVEWYGGGIYNAGSLEITDSEIKNNTATNSSGGGIYSSSTATIVDTSITDNTAGYVGGGIYNNGTLNLNGATITGNKATSWKGSGIYVNNKKDITLCGENEISGNTKDNLYIPTGVYLTIGGAVTGTVYIDTQVAPTDDTPVEFAKSGTDYTISDTDVDAFKSSSEDCVIKKNTDGNLELAVAAAEPHTCAAGTFDKVLNDVWPTSDGNLPAGNYYLTDNLETSNIITIMNAEVNICLNGHTITTSGSDDVLDVMGNTATLRLYDCQNTGKVTHAAGTVNGAGVFVGANSTFIMYGGTITGNLGVNGYGGGIYNKGNVTIHGGTIDGNTAGQQGGGIFNLDGSTMTIYGGTISNNVATSQYGGGIFNAGTLTIEGGTIDNNNSPSGGRGGGICNNKILVINGGEISNNTAKGAVGGGGIYSYGSSASLTITGGSIHHNNAQSYGGGITVATSSTATISGGSITENTAGMSGGGIYNNRVTLNLNGATITGNKVTIGSGGGVTMYNTSSPITLSGNNVIQNNTSGINTPSNLYIPTNGSLTISGGVTGTVCVDLQKLPTETTPVVFAKPATDYTILAADASAFQSSADGYMVKLNAGNLELAKKKTLTSADFMYTAPGDLHYTGTAKEATVTAKQSAIDAGVGTISVKYYDASGKEVTPTEVGTYTVKITDSNNVVKNLEMGTFTIAYITSPGNATLSGTTGDNDWYTGPVTITPPKDWKISITGGTAIGEWNENIQYTLDTKSKTYEYYLKDATGHITAKQTTASFKKDATRPDVASPIATNITDTTATITVTATDETSGIASYELEIGSQTMTATDGIFVVTGLTANTEYNGVVAVSDNAGNEIGDTVKFKTTNTPISTAAVTITAPVKDATPNTTATVAAGEHYTVSAVTWVPYPSDDKFIVGVAYAASFTLIPKAGYKFTDASTVTVAGATTTFDLKEDGSLSVVAQYPETPDRTLTTIAVDTVPKKTAYEATDKFEPAGLKLKLTYNNGSTEVVAYSETNKGDFTFSPAVMTMATTAVTVTYGGRTVDIPVTVTKKEVTAPTIAAKDYTGSTLTADVNDTADYTVTTNAGGTDAGDYDVVLTLKDYTNYKWAGTTDSTKTLTFTINKVAQAALTIESKPTTTTYGDNFTLTTTGGSGENAVTWAATKDLATVDVNGKVTVVSVGEITVTATKKADKNHSNDVSDSYTFTPNKATLTVQANSHTLNYGDALTGNGVTYSGWKNNDGETDLRGKLTYTSDTYTKTSPVGSSYTLTPAGLTSDNYAFDYQNGKLTVGQRPVTLTWAGADERAYDGKASNVTATAGNLVNNETLTVTVTGGTETNVGEYTATAAKLTGTTAANYKLPTDATKTYKIVQSSTTLTATANKTGYTYGDTITVTAKITPSGVAPATRALTAPTESQAALYYGDTQISEPAAVGANGEVILTYATTANTVPTGTQNLTVKYTGNKNMADASTDVSVTIAKKEVTAPTIVAADYTGKAQTATVATSERYTVKTNAGGTNAGDYDVVLTLTDADHYTWPNLTTADITLKFTINKVAQAGLTIVDQPTTVTYGDAVFTLKTEGGSGTGAVTWSAEGKAAVSNGKVTITGAGEATITATKAADGNHTEVVTATYKVTVAKKALTVTAKDHTITYGAEPAGNGVDYDGFVKDDDAAKLSGTLAYDHTYKQYDNVGKDYTITPKGLTSDNYDITFTAGTLTVEKLEATFTWSNTETRAYDGKASNVTAAVQNAQNNDTITVTVTGGTETDVGNHTATITGLTGAKAGNYKMPETNPTQTYSIVKSASDVTEINVEEASYVYGETVTIEAKVKAKAAEKEKEPGLFAMLAALVAPTEDQVALYSGDTQISEAVTVGADGSCTLTYDTKDQKLPVGTTTLTLRYAGNKNMAEAAATINVTITAKPVTVSAEDQTKKYEEKDPELTYTVTGLVGEDKLSGALARDPGEDVKDGGYAITQGTVTNTGNPNYDITYKQGTLTISPIEQGALTITDMPKAAIYGDAPFKLGTTGGSGKGEVTWTAAGPATVDKDGTVTITGVGDVTITAAKAADGNHTEQVTAVATVTVAKKALTWDTMALKVTTQKHWDGNDSAAFIGTLQVAGAVAGDTTGFGYKELSVRYATAAAGQQTITVTPVDVVMTNENYTLPTESITYDGEIIAAAPGKNETWQPEGSKDVYRLVLEDGVSMVPDGLEDTEFNTAEKITKQMKIVVSSKTGYTETNTKVYDVELQVSPDGGKTWTKATKENFPATGVTIRIPYPAGTNASNFDFVVTHMFTEDMNGHKAGEIETPEVRKLADYIEFTVMGLSPIAIAWKPVAKQTTNNTTNSTTNSTTKKPTSTTTSTRTTSSNTSVKPKYAAKTGDDSQAMLWMLLLLASGTGAAYVLITRRRKCKK